MRHQTTTLGFTALCALLIVACTPDTPTQPRLSHLHPQTALAQDGQLVLYGKHLGAYSPGHQIRFNNVCADPLFWNDEAIGIQVPRGIGIGVKHVQILWETGERLRFDIDVEGSDLPVLDKACDKGLVVVADVQDDVPFPDTTLPPDTRDTSNPPPDTIVIPDGGTCPPNLTMCGNVCVDLVSDSANCGACGLVCGDSVCVNATCVSNPPGGWPPTPDAYVAQKATFMSRVTIPDIDFANNMPVCCKDYGDISRDDGLDNSYALLAPTLSGLGLDMGRQIADGIERGLFVSLLDHRGLDGPTDLDGFTLATFHGSYEGQTDYVTALSGLGTFLLSRLSFRNGSGEPLSVFSPANMRDGVMTARGGTMHLALGFGFTAPGMLFPVQDVELSANASIEPDRVFYENGTLSGYLTVDDVFETFNTYARNHCECLGLDGPLFQSQPGSGEWRGQCLNTSTVRCEETACLALAGDDVAANPPEFCLLYPALLPQLADLDLNGNAFDYEGISIGLFWEGVGARILGVQ